MKKILLPTDFSDAAQSTLTFALHLAADLGAQLEIVHICNEPALAEPDHETEYAVSDRFNTLLDKLDPALLLDVPYQIRHAYGALMPTLLGCVHSSKPDLVLSGTQGPHLFDFDTPGSTSARMVGNLNTPLLVVPFGTVYKAPSNFVYAVDFKDAESRSVRSMHALAQQFGGKLHFVHFDADATLVTKEEFLNYQKLLSEALYDEYCSYSVIRADEFSEGLDKLFKTEKVDWLVVRTHLENEPESAFTFSNSRIAAMFSKTPVLIWPSNQNNSKSRSAACKCKRPCAKSLTLKI